MVSAYLRHRLLADVLSLLGGWPDPPRKRRVQEIEPRVTPPEPIQDGWPLIEDVRPSAGSHVDPER
jgi:hypothetical protein